MACMILIFDEPFSEVQSRIAGLNRLMSKLQ